jgi:hypothetical protein
LQQPLVFLLLLKGKLAEPYPKGWQRVGSATAARVGSATLCSSLCYWKRSIKLHHKTFYDADRVIFRAIVSSKNKTSSHKAGAKPSISNIMDLTENIEKIKLRITTPPL